ncbi:hypothetical protein [Frankia sp. Cr2]|uniref:hypothetical protein n=1 Tax=Frankia sp. Cr2 TaxID=3073932 RepID=UPI002AD20148|nr:hypothetical protein [Frankia sp. Cr2]
MGRALAERGVAAADVIRTAAGHAIASLLCLGATGERLTVFVKTRMREVGEVARARRAPARCLAEEHTLDEDDGNSD